MKKFRALASLVSLDRKPQARLHLAVHMDGLDFKAFGALAAAEYLRIEITPTDEAQYQSDLAWLAE